MRTTLNLLKTTMCRKQFVKWVYNRFCKKCETHFPTKLTIGSTSLPMSYSCIVATDKCLSMSSQMTGVVYGDLARTYVATRLTCDKNKFSLSLVRHRKHSPMWNTSSQPMCKYLTFPWTSRICKIFVTIVCVLHVNGTNYTPIFPATIRKLKGHKVWQCVVVDKGRGDEWIISPLVNFRSIN